MVAMMSSMWMSYLTIPEIFALRLVSKAFDDLVMNRLCLPDISLQPSFLVSQPEPLRHPAHPLHRLILRSAGSLRSLVYRPDLTPPDQLLIRRPLSFLSLDKCFAVQFVHPRGIERFRSQPPLVPLELLLAILPLCQFSVERLDLLLAGPLPGAPPSPSPALEFPRLRLASLILCPPSRLYRPRPNTPLAQLVARSRFPLLRSVCLSGQDPALAAAFRAVSVSVSLREPRVSHLSQLRQLARSTRALGLDVEDPASFWDISELHSLRVYYVLKMLQFLGACPRTRVERLVMAVGADQLSLLIPHLLHVEKTMHLGCVNLATQSHTGLHRDGLEDTAGEGLMEMTEVVVLRDELSAPLFLGTVDQFAVDVVEIKQSIAGDGHSFAALDRLQDEHNRVLQYHQRHFLDGTWMPHVFLHNIP